MAGPLIVVLFHDRLAATGRTLDQIRMTTVEDIDEPFDLVMVNNGSTDRQASRDLLYTWARQFNELGRGRVIPVDLQRNVGIPAALNVAMAVRRDKQPLIKVDNDCAIRSSGWLPLLDQIRREFPKIAMIGPYVKRFYSPDRPGVVRYRVRIKGAPHLIRVRPVFHMCAWHSGAFLDRVGYFDKLAPWHMCGYGDHMINEKAALLGYWTVVTRAWQVDPLRVDTTLGKQARTDHIARVRPLFQQRVQFWRDGGSTYTGPDGLPADPL